MEGSNRVLLNLECMPFGIDESRMLDCKRVKIAGGMFWSNGSGGTEK